MDVCKSLQVPWLLCWIMEWTTSFFSSYATSSHPEECDAYIPMEMYVLSCMWNMCISLWWICVSFVVETLLILSESIFSQLGSMAPQRTMETSQGSHKILMQIPPLYTLYRIVALLVSSIQWLRKLKDPPIKRFWNHCLKIRKKLMRSQLITPG